MICKLTSKTQQLIHRLEADVDVASRQSLQPYDDGRRWFFVRHPELSLARVAQVLMDGDTARMKEWVTMGQVVITPSLSCIVGEHFRVLWLEDAYVLAPHNRGGQHA